MVQELDSSFDAVCMIGYHGPAADAANPLSHTNTTLWNHITLNGAPMPEYLSHAHVCALEGVPKWTVAPVALVMRISDDAGRFNR